jgi:predicted dehydrogenase
MGKRRVRNLQALGHQDIGGFDTRSDRVTEAVEKYEVRPFSDFDTAVREYRPDALVISTGPRHHMDYAYAALERGLSCFIEASVVEADRILGLSRRIANTDIVMAPSCTMRFFPGPRKIKDLLQSGAIGTPLNFNYHTGQWLPDWHPWEEIGNFYVSDRATGGCREIVPFELTWLNDVFGPAKPLACVKAKLSDMPADIDDIYHCLLRYPRGVIGNITVEVLSRPVACRELRVIGSEGELVFNADENCVRHVTVGQPEWTRVDLGEGTLEPGYINAEEPYIAEMRAFVNAVEHKDSKRFPNNLQDDYRILQTLAQLEELAGNIA